MKLITAIAALALLAGSMDVEAQKRGKVGKPGDSDDDAPKIAPAPQIAPVAHMAIGAFGALGPEERKNLAEAAEGGDEEALQELCANHVEAIEAMLGALEDEDARLLIGLGMMLGYTYTGDDRGIVGTEDRDITRKIPSKAFRPHRTGLLIGDDDTKHLVEEKLDMVQEQLKAQFENWNAECEAESKR